jgi:transcriptional regulator with PAS, ATPase and Fis domain
MRFDDLPWGQDTELLSASERNLDTSLVILHRNGARIVPLSHGDAVTIGRAPPVDVLVQDNTLSRQHARFQLLEDRVFVQDLGSRNGVWMGKQRITRRALRPADAVSMGRIMVSVQRLDASESTMQRLSSHDQLVDLLEAEVSRARRVGSCLSILHVKATRKGATASQWFGKLVKYIRPVDNCALYSNTAVVVFLPDIGEKETQQLAERIDKSTACEDESDDPQLRFGISTYPDSAANADELLQASRRAVQRATNKKRIEVAAPHRFRKLRQSDPMLPAASPEAVVGSAAMKEVFGSVDRLAQTDIPVLVLGETGTGKEVVARAIHERGKRSGKELCCINCAAIPDSLVESILFGHVRGAFTGADRDSKGVFEEAHEGTVLLDEIAELPLPTQAKLLRVIETKQISRVGSTKERSMDVRIIAATHRNLEQMCESSQFRWDLFYRINTMTLRIPPLRERQEEIPMLVEHFIQHGLQDGDSRVTSIDPEALQLLMDFQWPGNVRELRNVIERAVVLAQGHIISTEDLPERVRLYREEEELDIAEGEVLTEKTTLDSQTLRDRVKEFEAQRIRETLRQSGGNQSEAARQLRVPLRSLVRKIKQYGI